MSRNKGQNELPVPAAHTAFLSMPVLPTPSCSRLGVLGKGMQEGRRSEPDVEFEPGED